MDTNTLRQRLIKELNENSFLLYAERQAFKQTNLPKELIEKKLTSFRKQKRFSLISFGVVAAFLILIQFMLIYSDNSHPLLQQLSIQFMPILGIMYFQANFQNISKRIFILELLRDWETEN